MNFKLMIMKYLFALLIPAAILLSGCGNSTDGNKDVKANADSVNLSGTLKVHGAMTLYPMMIKWGTVFMKDNPQVKLDIRSLHTEEALAELLSGKTDIAMMSRKPSAAETEKGLWYAAVAMDAVVPVISFDNPEIQPLVMHGITKEKLKEVFAGKIQNWGQISGRSSKVPVKVYALSDSAGTSAVWKQFLGLESLSGKATRVQTSTEMISHITSENGAIGYCSIMDAYDLQSGFRKAGLYILPLDYNANGTIEDAEQYYDKFVLVSNAVMTGKMPTPPARELYLVTKGKPQTDLAKAFIKWVLTIGQNYMPPMGYINITPQAANASVETIK